MLIRLVVNYMKVEETKTKNLSIEQYLDMIKLYLRDLINNHRELNLENGKFS